jgi:hypothetical protein
VLRLAAIAVLLHAGLALADPDPWADAADAPVPPVRVATPPTPPDPYQRVHWRIDGMLGASLGDGPTSFAARIHVGRSWWKLLGSDDDRWRPALRLTGGAALGIDAGRDHYFTAAPFGEVEVAWIDAGSDASEAKRVALFGRVEPVLLDDALGEHRRESASGSR